MQILKKTFHVHFPRKLLGGVLKQDRNEPEEYMGYRKQGIKCGRELKGIPQMPVKRKSHMNAESH